MTKFGIAMRWIMGKLPANIGVSKSSSVRETWSENKEALNCVMQSLGVMSNKNPSEIKLAIDCIKVPHER